MKQLHSEAYHGDSPGSELETQTLANFMKSHKQKIKGYVSIHSFGQYILTPWGFTRKKPKNFPKLFQVIKKVSKGA